VTTPEADSEDFGVRSEVSRAKNNNAFFYSAAEKHFHQPREKVKRLSTGSKHFNDLLSGGLEIGEISQFYGGPYTGKTHLCHLLCVTLPCRYRAIYIDTKGTFCEEKIRGIVEANRSKWKNILTRIQLAQPKDAKEQELIIEEACSSVKSDSNSKITLLIVDSMMFHYEAEYPGLSDLVARAHRLNIYMHNLRILGLTSKIAVVITNESTSNPRHEEVDDPRPFGGKIISHISTYIIHLKGTSRGTMLLDLFGSLAKVRRIHSKDNNTYPRSTSIG